MGWLRNLIGGASHPVPDPVNPVAEMRRIRAERARAAYIASQDRRFDRARPGRDKLREEIAGRAVIAARLDG